MQVEDLVLKQERLGTASDWTLGGANGGVSIAQFDVTYTNLDFRKNAFISTTPKYVTPIPTDPSARLRGDWQDPSVDELLLATIYLVSPPGAKPGSNPDFSWTPYYKNYVFWNLNHTTNLIPVQGDPNSISIQVPTLAGGVANTIFDAYIATNNDAYDAALEFLNNRTLEGRFWST